MLSRLDTDQTMKDKKQRSAQNKKDANRFWKSIEGFYTVVITNKGFSSTKMKDSYPNESVMEPLLVNPYEIRHVKQLNRHYGDIPNQLVLLMLDNLKKPASELTSLIERWAYLFKDSSMKSGVKLWPETKVIEDSEIIAGEDEAIREFIERVDIEHLPLEIRNRYLRALKFYNDAIFDIQEKGRAEGIAKERVERLIAGQVKTILGFIQKGKLTADDVMQSDDYSPKLKAELEKRLQRMNKA
jgi:hypothetical protein